MSLSNGENAFVTFHQNNNYYRLEDDLRPQDGVMETGLTPLEMTTVKITAWLDLIQKIQSTSTFRIDENNTMLVMEHLDNIFFQLANLDGAPLTESRTSTESLQQPWNSSNLNLNLNQGHQGTMIEAESADRRMFMCGRGKSYPNLSKVLDDEAMTILLSAMNYAYHGEHTFSHGQAGVMSRTSLSFWTKVDHEFLRAAVKLCPKFAYSIPWYLYAQNPAYSEDKCRDLLQLAEETKMQLEQGTGELYTSLPTVWPGNPRKRTSQEEIAMYPMLSDTQSHSSSENSDELPEGTVDDTSSLNHQKKKLKAIGSDRPLTMDLNSIVQEDHSYSRFPNVGIYPPIENQVDMQEDSALCEAINDDQERSYHNLISIQNTVHQSSGHFVNNHHVAHPQTIEDTAPCFNADVNPYGNSTFQMSNYQENIRDSGWETRTSHFQDVNQPLSSENLINKPYNVQPQESLVGPQQFHSAFELTKKMDRATSNDIETMFQETLILSSTSRSDNSSSMPRTSPISLKSQCHSPSTSDSRSRSRTSCYAPSNPLSLSPPARIRSYNPIQKKYEYECVFCKGNDQTEAVYKTHPIRINEVVICPFLRKHVCGICGATGDNAHTIKYCPFNDRGFFASRQHSSSSNSTWQSSMSSSSQSMFDTDEYEYESRCSLGNSCSTSSTNGYNFNPKPPVVRKLNFDIPANPSKSNSVFFKNLQQLQNNNCTKPTVSNGWNRTY